MKRKSILGMKLSNHIDRMVQTFKLVLWNIEPSASNRPVVPATDGKPTKTAAAPVTKAQGKPEKTFIEVEQERMETAWEEEKRERAARLERGKERYTK